MQNDETGVYIRVWNNNVQRTGRHTVKRQNAVRNKNRRKERANRRGDENVAKFSAARLTIVWSATFAFFPSFLFAVRLTTAFVSMRYQKFEKKLIIL